MKKDELIQAAMAFVEASEDNTIELPSAGSDLAAILRIYDSPIFAFGTADDPLFQKLKDRTVIGRHVLLPQEWLPQAKTVVSFFLPFSETVRSSNRLDLTWPSQEWLYGRIEGQMFINKLCLHLQSGLAQAGYSSIVPAIDPRFRANTEPDKSASNGDCEPMGAYTSNWSERHAAFICGLGTFGLSKGLITAKGIAGRFGSIITELELSPDIRNYTDVDEYCTKCGACVKKCPVEAISLTTGKDHRVCSLYLGQIAEKYKPRYGCGKCQVGVPCENSIPKRQAKDS